MRQEQEQQLLIQQEQQIRIQQEEQMRIQQEQELKRQQLEQEEMRRQEEMRIQEEERRRQEEQRRLQEEQMRIQKQQEEQMRIQMQQEEQRRIQMQQEEQMRIQMQQEEQMRIQMQKEEQMRIQMQQEEQMRMQMQQEEQMRMQMQQGEQMRLQQEEQMRMQQQEMMQQQQKKATKTQGFSYGVKQQDISHIGPKDAQLAMPPMSSSSSVFESSQSQQFSSVQQSSSSFSQTQSTNQIYESQEYNGGVMKGYKVKEEFSSEFGEGRNVRDSGVFTGINGDSNALVDEEFDRKKHTVKDLAKHFALVKPKQNIPHNILPEQRIYNGDHGPALNYLGASEADGQVHSLVRREMSQQDVEASKAAYEMKKKQQQMEQQQNSTTTPTSSSSTVVKRTESSSRSEQEAKSERRMSLRDSLMLDPAQAHADAGIIDPSAILRGCEVTGRRSTSEGVFSQSTVQGETDKILNKWDNHNTIARGWAGVQANYHPVTFRKMYNVDNQIQT